MYWISIAALSAAHFFFHRGRQAELAAEMEASVETPENQPAPEDQSSDRDTSGAQDSPEEEQPEFQADPLDIQACLKGVDDPLERHRIYTRGIDLAYRKKNSGDPAMRQKARSFAESYVEAFHTMKEAVFEDLGDSRFVPVFKQLAILYEEAQEIDKALNLCRQALLLGLEDGTKTGFQGRIDRLNKKTD